MNIASVWSFATRPLTEKNYIQKFLHFVTRFPKSAMKFHPEVSVKKVFLEILPNSQGNICVRVSFLIKSQALGLQLYLKRDSDTSVFFFLQNISGGCFWRPLSDFCNVKDITLLTLRKCHGLVYFIHLINLDLVVLENCVQM